MATATMAQTPILRFEDSSTGLALVGGFLYTYQAGSTSLLATYADPAQQIQLPNPIILNSRGEVNASPSGIGASTPLYLQNGVAYKFILTDSLGNVIWTVDNITSVATLSSLTASTIGALLYPQTAAELAANVTATNFTWPPGDVRRYGADPTGVVTSTTAFQLAFNVGQHITIPEGIFKLGAVTVPSTMKGYTITGAGFYNYSQTSGTILIAAGTQASILAHANGADNVSYSNIRFDANNTANICVDGTYGAFLTFYNVGLYNSLTFGFYGLQGVLSFNRVYGAGNAAVGMQIYSDTALNHVEMTGGTIPISIVAGGNRLVNIWANSGSVAQISLTPLNNAVTHINTSMTNLYVGETSSTSSAPIIQMIGTTVQAVQHVQISNSFIVQGVAAVNKVNGGILCSYVNDLVVSNVTMFAMGSYATSNNYTDYFFKASNSNRTTLTGCNINGVNYNAINLGSTVDQITLSGCNFFNCGGYIGTGTQGANIISSSATTHGTVAACSFICSSGSSVPYMANIPDSRYWVFNGLSFSYASTNTVISANSATYPVNGSWLGNAAPQWSLSNPNLVNMTVATSAIAGANGAAPAQVAGYITVPINGVAQKIPYYN